MIDDTRLVQTLLKEGVADQATVDLGLAKTETSGESLYETLIASKLVAESDLVGLVAKLLDIPTRDIDTDSIADEVSALIPASMARRNRVLPIELLEGRLILGMANPVDNLALDEISSHAGVKIDPVLIGPTSISAALRALYPGGREASPESTDVLMDAFDDFEVGELVDEMLAGDEWSDLFEESSQLEDSSVLSRDMQDRPSTDVLAEEDLDLEDSEVSDDELPEIEIIEELGQPIQRKTPAPFASLDTWEVDGAIEGASEILSAQSAGELFQSDDQNALIEDSHVEATSNLEIEQSEAHTDALETSSKTSVGLGLEQLAEADGAGAARPKKSKRITLDNTGKTELGMRPGASQAEESEGEAEADPKALKPATKPRRPARKSDDGPTDYGALGRAILKSGPVEDEEGEEGEDAGDTGTADADEVEAPDEEANDNTNVAEAEDKRPTNPRIDGEPIEEIAADAIEALPAETHDDEADDDDDDEGPRRSHTSIVVPLFEDDDDLPPLKPEKLRPPRIATPRQPAPPRVETLPPRPLVEADAGTRPRLSSPAIELPEEIDAQGLALALANLLVAKGILTTDEVFALAKRLSNKKI